MNELCNSNGCLKDEYGRFDKGAGTPFSRNTLRLGKKELRLKSSVVGKFNSQEQGQRQQRTSAGRANTIPQTNNIEKENYLGCDKFIWTHNGGGGGGGSGTKCRTSRWWVGHFFSQKHS